MARVLVIEDNPENLELMTYLLRAFGHAVVTATDGAAGMAAAAREAPDLVVCDLHLPGVDGYEVARRLKADPELAAIPRVAVTALAMAGDRERGLAAGFDGYLTKPIDAERFVEQVEGFLRLEQRGEPPKPPPAAEPESAIPAAPLRATVLVVDDSPVNRDLIRDTLQPSGYRVRLAQSPAEALELLAVELPDLILSDLHMPGEDGFGLIHRIKADPRLARLPFIFISSSVWGEQDRERALRFGVTRFLLRPIEPRALLDEVEACLAGAP